jgi:hypothetical protein
MKKTTVSALVLTVACGLASGCGKARSTDPTGTQEVVKYYTELNGVLAKIKDKQSAEDARPKLRELAERLKNAGEEDRKLEEAAREDPSIELHTRSEAQQKRINDLLMQYRLQRARIIKDVEGGEELFKEYDEASLPSSPPAK